MLKNVLAMERQVFKRRLLLDVWLCVLLGGKLWGVYTFLVVGCVIVDLSLFLPNPEKWVDLRRAGEGVGKGDWEGGLG